MELARDPYQGFHHHHMKEVLADREELMLSRSSLWRILSWARVLIPSAWTAPAPPL